MPFQEVDGTYRAVVKISQKRVAQKRGFKSYRAAHVWEVEERERLLKKTEQRSLELLSLTIEYMEYAKRYSSDTYKEKLALTNRILARWGKAMPVEDINPKMGLDYLQEQEQARSANAANRDRKNLVAMWNWGKVFLKDQGMPEANPFLIIKRFAHDRAPQYVPPRADVLKLKAACDPVEYSYLCTMLQTGGRRSEIHRLCMEDVDLVHRKIRLKNRKSRDGSLQERWIDMSDELTAVLTRWLKIRPIKDTVWLFYVTDNRSRHYGKPFTKRRRFLKGLCKRAGVREMGYHALRRHVASFLAAKGAPLKFIQDVLGHADIKTTDRYIYNIIDDQRSLINLLNTDENKPIPEEQSKSN